MDVWLESWVRLALARIRGTERGSADVIIVVLLLILIWIVYTGRRLAAQ